MFTRRQLIQSSVGSSLAAALPPHPAFANPKRVLVLGGTVYLGPAIVEYARARGHIVTLFNRGKTNPGLFPDLELIRGDRDPEHSDLSGLADTRRWDAVVDVWPDDPAMVAPAVQLLKDRTDYYFYVSSIAAYHDYRTPGMDETAPMRMEGTGYSTNKARSEITVTQFTSGHAGIVRPAAIFGPRNEGRAFQYWLTKLARPSDFVAPGDGSSPVQYVDVRDVGRWIVDCVETKRAGVYNTFSRPMSFRSFLQQCGAGIRGKGSAVWIDGSFLRSVENVKTYDNMPLWNPDRPGFGTISTAKAESVGWVHRPLADTARDAFTSYAARFPNASFPQIEGTSEWGLSDDRERKILTDWRTRKT